MPNYTKQTIDTSELFKALAHPARVCIVSKLRYEELNVNQMQECLDISQPNVSQHLSILKKLHIIIGTRYGSEIVYSLANEKVKKLINIIMGD